MGIVDQMLIAKLEAAQIAGESDGITNHIVSYVVNEYGVDLWPWAAEQCAVYGMRDAYTDLRMRIGEGV